MTLLIKEENGKPTLGIPKQQGILESFPFQVFWYFVAVLAGGAYGYEAIRAFGKQQDVLFAYLFINMSYLSLPLIFFRFHLKYLREKNDFFDRASRFLRPRKLPISS